MIKFIGISRLQEFCLYLHHYLLFVAFSPASTLPSTARAFGYGYGIYNRGYSFLEQLPPGAIVSLRAQRNRARQSSQNVTRTIRAGAIASRCSQGQTLCVSPIAIYYD